MNLDALQTPSGFFKIAAFDHRDSLQKVLAEQFFKDFKNLLAETFAPLSTAILVDPEYGSKAIQTAKDHGLGILLSREESGYVDDPQGRETKLYREFTSYRLHEMGANGIKLLLYYNHIASSASKQREIAKSILAEAHSLGLPLILEVVVYSVEGYPFHKGDTIIRAIKDLREYCDVFKLEFPLEIINRDDELEQAIPYLEAITMESQKPWVLLSRGAMKFDAYKKALKLSLNAGCKGFAVGRSVWQEAFDKPNWNSIVDFIKTTGKSRMEELSKLF